MSKQPVRARLLDALLSDVILPPLPATDVALDQDLVFQHNAGMRQILGGAVCIEATNVARFFDDNYLSGNGSSKSAKDAHNAFWSDLKCLVPPHKKFFIEWDQPRIPTAKRMGMLFVACTPDQADGIARSILGEGARMTPTKIAEFSRDVRCKWIYLTLDFLEFPHKNDGEHISGLRGPFHIGTMSIAEDGTLINFWMSHGSILSEDESVQVGAASLVGWTTLAMLNCANITTAEHKAPDAFQKARVRGGKKPLVSFHTVSVDLGKTPSAIAAGQLPTDEGTAPRRHQKRGHMKDYRRGGGLFGRYKGVWYWGPTLAGSADKGIVVSDYEVTP